jgi:hypothetical protein
MNVHNSCLAPWSGSGVRLTSIMLALHALPSRGGTAVRDVVPKRRAEGPLLGRTL